MRAILLASAIAASFGGLRASKLVSHGIARLVVPRRAVLTTEVAPTTSKLRSVSSPARVIRPSRVLPAVEWSFGVSPSQQQSRAPMRDFGDFVPSL